MSLLCVYGLMRAVGTPSAGRRRVAPAALTAAVMLLGSAGAAAGSASFVDVTEQVGLAYRGPSWGASWGDYDGDGRADLWVGNHTSGSRLFRNRVDGTFEDVTTSAGVALRQDIHGAAWGDPDSDGDQDLVVLVGAGRGTSTKSNVLFVNRRGRFTDEATASGLADSLGRGRVPVWLDQDGDGRLDVYFTNAARAGAPSRLFEQVDGVFAGLAESEVTENVQYAQLAALHAFSAPGLILHGVPFPASVFRTLSPCCQNGKAALGLPGYLYAYDSFIGDLFGGDTESWVGVTATYDSDFNQPEPRRLDVHLAPNGTASEIAFAAGQGRMTFHAGAFFATGVATSAVRLGAQAKKPTFSLFTLSPSDVAARGMPQDPPPGSQSLDIGYDRKAGLWRVRAVSQVRDNISVRVTAELPIVDIRKEHLGPEPLPARPWMLAHREGRWLNVAAAGGLAPGEGFRSIVAGDFDNDMDIDLFTVCSTTARNTADRLYENLGDGTFRLAGPEAGVAGASSGTGDSATVVDYDNDGYLDLFVTNGADLEPFNDGPSVLLRNVGGENHWLEMDLVGTYSNRDAIGARVSLTAAGRMQRRLVGADQHAAAQNFRRLHFGLGGNSVAETVRIDWPSGLIQVLHTVMADRVVSIIEPKPVSRGDVIADNVYTAGDALAILSSAVGLRFCLPRICDYSRDGNTTAVDAFGVLRAAVLNLQSDAHE